MKGNMENWAELSISNDIFPRENAQYMLEDDSVDILQLVNVAGRVRMKFFGRQVKLHQINNIQWSMPRGLRILRTIEDHQSTH
jgi:biotin synthase